jgi:hypothetical protein
MWQAGRRDESPTLPSGNATPRTARLAREERERYEPLVARLQELRIARVGLSHLSHQPQPRSQHTALAFRSLARTTRSATRPREAVVLRLPRAFSPRSAHHRSGDLGMRGWRVSWPSPPDGGTTCPCWPGGKAGGTNGRLRAGARGQRARRRAARGERPGRARRIGHLDGFGSPSERQRARTRSPGLFGLRRAAAVVGADGART